MSAALKTVFAQLRAAALAFPETNEDFPWGHSAFKVSKKKAFCFLALEGAQLSMSCKLPESNGAALTLPFAEPTGYGLGKSGWVTATFAPAQKVPVALLTAWLDESSRAVAPKKLHARIGEAGPAKKARPVEPKTKTPAS